jgi:uncharacterized glyoxalase superfamily protein PhnB
MMIATCLAIALTGCKADSKRNQPLVDAARACAHADLSCPRPIVQVANLRASQRYYRDALGFQIDWEYGEPADISSVSRGDSVIFLCQGCQGAPGSVAMVFTHSVDRLHEELARKGALIKAPPRNMPWGLREMQVADLDGNVLRIASPIDE